MIAKDLYVTTRLEEVEQALQKASAWGASDAELGAYLAGYLVVMLCGVIEDCVEHLVYQRAIATGDKGLASFVQARVHAGFRNPDMSQIKGLVKDFGESFRSAFQARLTSLPQGAESALDSAVTNKNKLAHGNLLSFSVTIRDVEWYMKGSSQVLEVLEIVLGD